MVLSTNAFSKEISYDYLEGTYSLISDSSLSVDVDADGFAIGGSFSISPNIAITASFGAIDYDRVVGVDIESSGYNFGITTHTSIATGTDVFGNFSVVNSDVEASNGFATISDDDTGNSITVGLRHMITDSVEISAAFSRVDIFNDTGNMFGFGTRFYTGEKFSIGIGYSTADDVDSFLLNARIDLK